MARNQAEDYEDKRAAIREQASQLFASKSFHAVSISDLAAACGVSKSSLYHYFDSKEQILFEILDEHAEHLAQIAGEVAGDVSLDARGRLRAYAARLIETNVASRDKHTLILGELEALPEEQRRDITEKLRQPITIWFDTFAELNPALADKPDQRFPLVMMFIGMINWTHTWFDAKGALTTDAFARMIADTFLEGYVQLDLDG